MKTQQLVEGILYASGDHTIVRECLLLCHILNDSDRHWKSTPHVELFYLDAFKRPYFLYVVDKQLHVYIIGQKAKGKTYNIINIEGFSAEHMTISKSELKDHIYQAAKDSKNLYLPNSHHQRIVFIKPDYSKDTLDEDSLFVFNRQSTSGTLFSRSMWSLGSNVYSASVSEYETSANNILQAIFTEF